MLNQRAILASLSRNDLLALVDHFDLQAPDRRVRDNLIGALAASRSTPLSAMLGRLSLAALIRICDDHDVALASKKKAARVEAIVQATQRSKAPARAGSRAARPAAVPAPVAKEKKPARAKKETSFSSRGTARAKKTAVSPARAQLSSLLESIKDRRQLAAKPTKQVKKRSASAATAHELSSAVKQAEAIMRGLRKQPKVAKKEQMASPVAVEKKSKATKKAKAAPAPIEAKKTKKVPQMELSFALENEPRSKKTRKGEPSPKKSEPSPKLIKLADTSIVKKITPRDKKAESVLKAKPNNYYQPAAAAPAETKATHRPAPRFADAWPKPASAIQAETPTAKKQNGAVHIPTERVSQPESIRRPQPHPSYRAAPPAVVDMAPAVAAQPEAPSPAPAALQSEEFATQPLRITMTTQSIKDALETAPDELPRPLVPDAMAFVQTRLTKKCRSCQKPIEMRKCGVQRCSNMLLANPARKICAECLFERNTISMVDFNERLEEEAHCPHCNDAWETLS
jgi:hypothetical protein